LKKSSAKILPKGTLLFTSRATIGDVGIAEQECSTNQGFQSFLPNNKYETIFLYNWIIKNRNEFIKKSSGSTFLEINKTEIAKIQLNIPTLPEQKKIASFLTAVDSKLQALKKKKALLEEYKKGIMQKIFNGEWKIENGERKFVPPTMRFKPNSNDIVNSQLSTLNYKDWEVKTLGEYFTHKSDRNKNIDVKLVLSVSNKKGFISQSEQFEGHSVASKDLSNYKIVKKGDVAYNPSRINVGSIATLKDFDIGVVSPMYVVFSLKDNFNITFFENIIHLHRFKHLVKIGCSGSVRDSLNFDDLCLFELPIPSLEEQTKIANFLTAIDDKIMNCELLIMNSEKYKKGLLQKMFV